MKYFRSPLSLLLNVIVMVSLNSYASESMDHNKTIVPTSQQAQDSARRVLGLLGYIQGDYPAAIQNSQIKNELEYKELVSFTKAANQLLIKILAMTRTNQLSTKSIQVRKDLSHAMQQLERQIKARAPHSEVVRVTSMMNKALIAEFRIPHVPNETPNWAAAASLYNRSCTSCHGALGKGDGPAAKHLSPAPPNFTKSDTLHLASPFRFYNIVKDGIQGTAMPAFGKVFSDQQIWNLSFFLFTLVPTTSPSTSFDRSENSINERITQSLNLDFKKLATLSNKEIEEKIKDTLGTKLAHLNHHVEPIIRHIRRDTSFKPIADRSNKQSLTQDHLQHAIDKAENALQAIQANKR